MAGNSIASGPLLDPANFQHLELNETNKNNKQENNIRYF